MNKEALRAEFEAWAMKENFMPANSMCREEDAAWDAYQACAAARDAEVQRLREALEAFMALDKTFSTVCDKHLDAMAAKGGAMARAVKLARAALEAK